MLYMGYKSSFDLKFWNVIPNLSTTQNLPQTLNKYPQTPIQIFTNLCLACYYGYVS